MLLGYVYTSIYCILHAVFLTCIHMLLSKAHMYSVLCYKIALFDMLFIKPTFHRLESLSGSYFVSHQAELVSKISHFLAVKI